jgi:hypothetical protein
LQDKKGKVVAEAHGYGDDHYLPFKLNSLGKLRNGSYVRTRSTGGPTTEDIYTAGVTGAKKFTVVSRQGVYEIGFDPEFTHHKRFGDIALGMSKRYGKILGAVASGQVREYGEVSDQQMQDFYDQAHEEMPEDIAEEHQDAWINAHVQDLVEQQQSKEGRRLKLNGEGYNYALQSLASQYPYYLHYAGERRYSPGGPSQGVPGRPGRKPHPDIGPTGFTRPQHQRFWDTPESGSGHLERIGHAFEVDSGYVKPRHIKSANALVGYFDPSIGGESRGKEHERAEGEAGYAVHTTEGTGKVRGDLAYYQNWARNPFNENEVEPQGPQPGQDAARLNQTAQEVADQRASGHRAAHVMQGQGAQTANVDADKDKQELRVAYKKLMAYYNNNPNAMKEEEHGLARLWSNDAFNAAYSGGNPESLRFKIHEALVRRLGPEHGIISNKRSDEIADKALGTADEQAAYNEHIGFLGQRDAQGNYVVDRLRDQARDTIAALKERGSDNDKKMLENIDPTDDQPYLDVDTDYLMGRMYPAGGALEQQYGKDQVDAARAGAREWLSRERQLRDLEAHWGIRPEDGWVSNRLAEQQGRRPKSADEQRAEQEAELDAARDISSEQQRTAVHDAGIGALEKIRESHKFDEPGEKQFDNESDFRDAHTNWSKKRSMINQAMAAWDDLEPDTDTSMHRKGGTILNNLLSEYPDLATEGVAYRIGDKGAHHMMSVDQFTQQIDPEGYMRRKNRGFGKSARLDEGREIAKRFGISKRNGNFVIRRVA